MEKTPQSNLPKIASDYIDAVIKSMRYRKKIRQDVREELFAHFTDALADCQTEDERIALAKDLIKEFGDVKLLGKLMRRAKKRCRPLWRTMVVRLFQAVGVMFLLLALYIGWFLSGKPVVTTNYVEVMNQQVRPVADETLNAWPYYKQAAEKYVEPNDKKFDLSLRPLAKLSDADRGVILQLIKDYQESLDMIRQGNQKPYYWQVYDTGETKSNEVLAMLLPYSANYKDLSRLLCWQALMDAEQGNMQKAFDNTLDAYAFGQHLRGQNTTLIEQLVAIAIEALSTNTMRMLLDENLQTIDLQTLDSVRNRFESMVSKGNFIISFEAEKLILYDELQRSFTQSQFGKSHLYAKRFGEIGGIGPFWDHDLGEYSGMAFFLLHPNVLFTHPDREQTRQAVDRFYAEMSRLAAKTPASLHKEGVDMNNVVHDLTQNNILLRILVPALGKITRISFRCQADTAATLTIFAILQYHKSHAAFPDSLDSLVQSSLLDKLPMDPFSDAPLVYRKTDGGFTLYSVGLNFVDDGGVPGKDSKGKTMLWSETEGDAVFWPVQKD
jgi:hypothetical protein